MSTDKDFLLPDLGEGLPDAEIVEWLVKEGDSVMLDQPLVSMETAKAVVEVPSPYSGVVTKLHGKAGDVIDTGAALASFAVDPALPQRAEAEDTGHHHAPRPKPTAPEPPSVTTAAPTERVDAGTVVGAMQASNEVKHEAAIAIGGIKAMPAVRAAAKKLGVDLTRVRPSGPDAVITMQDVKNAVASPPSLVATATIQAAIVTPPTTAAAHGAYATDPRSLAGKPVRTTPPTVNASGQPEPIRGVRRNMARIMAEAHAQVVPTMLCDDADLHAWAPGNDITARLIRAIVVACKAEPALNAWFDMANSTRTLHRRVDIGIAVDTPEGLFVPALRNADMLDAGRIREGVNRLRAQVEDRSIAADELKGYTISLSNFGMYAGRYATPVIVPPCVAIIAAGKGRHQLVPVMGGIETHKVLPLSLTFDHRAATGGEAARFLKAMLDDLARPS
ncbi:MAG: 2-oxo acid dehydrogenase subunit E2 [Rhodanobacteraceae bacterium]|nr:2-oxo acid dehydrogenase subunit E2 [Rhodanobacteraceae bacterium]MBP9154866.1 2-oxo acid dehydrogenase subunit E2 [Xanthomonadales bacterium]HQW81444.1 dihydrolipoamide acetyltransferase family protein [Pseudomonadota bacterium]